MTSPNPKKLSGGWNSGYALDLHTSGSEFIGYNSLGQPQFDTTRTELGDLLYQAKYAGKKTALDSIAKIATQFIRSQEWKIDCIVPVPPSNAERKYQPVGELADRISVLINIPVCTNCLVKVKDTHQLKNVYDLSSRQKELEGAFDADKNITKKKNILLLDDLYRSGATLNEISRTLFEQGAAAKVYVLTVTKTRSNL